MNVPPSRARRQFAARLAARRAEAEAASHDLGSDEDEDEDDELARLHREDSGEKVGFPNTPHHFAGAAGEIRSDDSVGDEGEDVGIVMRKSMRRTTDGSGGMKMGGNERRALFSLDRASSGSGDDDEDIELEGATGEGEKERIVEAFERLGIDVRTPEGLDDEDEELEVLGKGKGKEVGVM